MDQPPGATDPTPDVRPGRPDPFGPEPPSVEPDELAGWIVHEDQHLLVIDKPGWLVCHPSKRGPRSSLVGACREHTGLDRLHLVSRLDRETSGLVVLAKDAELASRLQKAVQERRVARQYLAILDGRLDEPVEVDAPLGPDPESAVRIRVTVGTEPVASPDGQPDRHLDAKPAFTRFEPIRTGQVPGGRDPARAGRPLTLARVLPRSGRKHQIRAHAYHIGHPVTGDKIYGPDETLFLEFIEQGWTERLARQLPIRRQALHLARLDFALDDDPVQPWPGPDPDRLTFEAPLPADMARLIGLRAGDR